MGEEKKKNNKMSEKKTIHTQFGVSAGEFALVDKILYDQLMQSVEDLAIHCQELDMESIFLSNVLATVKKLKVGRSVG